MSTNAVRFEKRNFMGIELDVLVGHPEHELLFVATQVAAASGLKAPKETTRNFVRQHRESGRQIRDLLVQPGFTLEEAEAKAALPYPRWRDTWVFNEAEVYLLLLRGHAPQSEPFRKWVTEEVLPTIRKTGQYNAEESSSPIAQGIIDQLRLVIREELQAEFKAHLSQLAAQAPWPTEPSPYDGDTKSTVYYLASAPTIREVAESMGLGRPGIDKAMPRIILCLEHQIGVKWDREDGRKLTEAVSAQQRKWREFPTRWLTAELSREAYRAAISKVISEAFKV